MNLEITGTVKEVFETQVISETFKKREFVIETEGEYPQMVKFELTKDKCDLLESRLVGAKVKVKFNIRGNEYQGKYYNNLQAWFIEFLEYGAEQPSQQQATQPKPSFEAPPMDSDEDDIPF